MDLKDYTGSMSEDEKTTASAKAKELAASLTEAEIEAIKRCAAKAGSVKALFADPEFRRIIDRRGGDGK